MYSWKRLFLFFIQGFGQLVQSMYNIIREKIFVIFCCINLTDIYERKIVLADDALLQ